MKFGLAVCPFGNGPEAQTLAVHGDTGISGKFLWHSRPKAIPNSYIQEVVRAKQKPSFAKTQSHRRNVEDLTLKLNYPETAPM